MTTVTLQLDDDLLSLADERAANSGQSVDVVLASALRRGLGAGRLSNLLTQARRGSALSEGEAMALAKAELKALRDERRSA
ncbi:MAG: hypothetical protein LBQ06_00460 [Frankiaceae bacterium]|jgi:predicted transcriptional regulator|nr:hypothetical protein [Frankiaceae bacterium]